MKVLVIDDDKLVRIMCKNILSKEGHTVIEAINGNDGLRLFKAESPDITITDMLMPDKEGLETISDIKKINKNAKIIAMSSGGNTLNMSFLKLAQQIGADSLLKKPFKPSELLATMQLVIKA